jgi:hypothetical protein
MRRGNAMVFVDIEKNAIYKRLNKIIQFRYQHNQLKQIILKTLSKSSIGADKAAATTQRNFEEKALNDINEAYDMFLKINVLDLGEKDG